MEVDILADGSLDLPDSCLARLDVVVASVHSHMRMSKSRPCCGRRTAAWPLEIDAQPDRLDLGDVHIRRARELGVNLAIDSDAHTTDAAGVLRYGVDQARRGWLEKDDVPNTLPLAELREWLRRRRRSAGVH